MDEIERLLIETRERLAQGSTSWAIYGVEEARYAARNDGRLLKRLDRFANEHFDPATVHRAQAETNKMLETVCRWLTHSRFDDDLWFMALDDLRAGCAFEAMAERRRDITLDLPLLEVALAALGDASENYRSPLYLSNLAKTGPLLRARIEQHRGLEAEGRS